MNNDMYMSGTNYELNYDDDDYEPCSKKILPSLFAWFLLISSTSSYFTLVLPMYLDIFGTKKFYLFIIMAFVHAILFLYLVINFTMATFVDPGRFPKVDMAESIETNNSENPKTPITSNTYKNVLINDINVRMKWCTTCQFYRPPRSSHCGVCNACIDTMDHHCPWVCNCIARRNYKYFLSFLISLTLHMIAIFSFCLTLVLLNKDNLTNIPIITAILLIILISVLIIPIGGLTGFHLILVSRGRTTNEQVTGKFRTGVNPFDKGFFQNWKHTLFSSIPPSYIKFRRKRLKLKEYYQTKLLLLKYSNPSSLKLQNQKNNNNRVIYNNSNLIREKERDAVKIVTSQTTSSSTIAPPSTKSYSNQNNLNGKYNILNKNTNHINTNGNHNNNLIIGNGNGNGNNGKHVNMINNNLKTTLNAIHRNNQHQQNELELKYNNYLNHDDNSNHQLNHQNSNTKNHHSTNRIINNNTNNISTNNKIRNSNQVRSHYKKECQNGNLQKGSKSNRNSINKTFLNNNNNNNVNSEKNSLLINGNANGNANKCIRNNSYLNANHNLILENINFIKNQQDSVNSNNNHFININHDSDYDDDDDDNDNGDNLTNNNHHHQEIVLNEYNFNTNRSKTPRPKNFDISNKKNTFTNNKKQIQNNQHVCGSPNDYASYEITV